MKVLSLSKNKLELGSTQLRRPLIIIGRSPTCDVVLRAPGIKPLHFIIEWIGSGKFDPSKGNWAIVDISTDAEAGEGVVLGNEAVTLGEISFHLKESALASKEEIGGHIVENLGQAGAAGNELLEFVQVRTDSGAIEEISHVPVMKKKRIESLSKEFKSFKIEHPGMKTEVLINLLLDEMPDAVLLLAGKKIDPKNILALKSTDFLQVKWRGRDFYLRFVEEVSSTPIPVDFWGDPLLKKMTGIVAALVLLFTAWVYFGKTEVIPEKELPRVARVEIPAPPVVPPPTDQVAKEANALKEKTETAKKETDAKEKALVQANQKNSPGKAAAAKDVHAPTKAPNPGLNIAAPTTNVNQVGLLGSLNKNMKKGPGVQAEKVLNQGIIKESVTSQDHSKVVLKTPPAGVIGSGDGGSPTGSGTKNLGAASTALSGISKADPNSRGLIARKGGESGFQLGSSNSGAGTGISGSAGSGLGNIDAGDFSVVGGGLDRATVKKIIDAHRNQIRSCYERALISAPSLNGRIAYKWLITPQGPVATVSITKTTVESANLKLCVQDVIQKMMFPKAPNGLSTTVIYPFVFAPKH